MHTRFFSLRQRGAPCLAFDFCQHAARGPLRRRGGVATRRPKVHPKKGRGAASTRRDRSRGGKSNAPQRGSVLLLVLGILILATILIVGLLQFSSVDRAASQVSFQGQRAKLFADMGLDYAVAQIRDATTAGSQSGKFWSSQPGRITVFNANGTVDTVNSRTLISQPDTNLGTAGTVDLNQASFSSTRPIASPYGATAPAMPAPWVNVLADPLSAAAAGNPIVGRYAFWVDDETTKMNINTADGTVKGTASSFGAGTPTEVSLQALTMNGTNIPSAQASAIAIQSGAQPAVGVTPRYFSTPRDILGVTGVSSSLLPENTSDITAYNRAPELNNFGEPRIYLATASLNSPVDNTLMNGMVGAQITQGAASASPPGLPLTEVYPSSGYYNRITKVYQGNQLPAFKPLVPATVTYTPPSPYPLPQYFAFSPYVGSSNDQSFPSAASSSFTNFYTDDYMMGMRIAQYLEGYDSQTNSVQWPVYPGADAGGFSGKYTKRQIDSIALQILSLMKLGVYADNNFIYSLPPILPKGFLSGQPVAGIGRTPKVTAVQVVVTATQGQKNDAAAAGGKDNVALLSFDVYVQFFFPDEFSGIGYGLNNAFQWNFGNYSQISVAPNTQYMCLLNYPDAPAVDVNSTTVRTPNTNAAVFTPAKGGASPTVAMGPSCLGDYWMDNLLVITDQNGTPAGVDLFGNDPTAPDPDQGKAALYHPYCLTNSYYAGSGPGLSGVSGSGNSSTGAYGACPALEMVAGGFGNQSSGVGWQPGEYRTMRNRFAGAQYPTKPGVTQINISGGLDIWTDGPSLGTKELSDPVPLDSIRGPLYTSEDITPTATDQTARKAVLAAVIPITMSMSVPGTATVTMAVADPIVNKFPGDWQAVNGANLPLPTSTTSGPRIYTAITQPNGVPTGYLASNGGDPAALWWPPQVTTIPKVQRFPSIGYLQYIRTGIMPDTTEAALPIGQQHGTAWRLLNYAPSTDASQKTDGGKSYPDWAMLDLFTVPGSLQANLSPLPAANYLTYGGATTGRINPNAALYSFPSVTRVTPMQGLLKGVQTSKTYDASNNPQYTTVDEKALATAIATYEASLKDSANNPRPFLSPGEICNVPEVAALLSGSGGRNDLVRQVVGNITTRSNTFSVWAVGQAVQKLAKNTQYGTVESGDLVLSESRVHYIVERMVDPGKDGALGNPSNSGVDGIVSTPDDPTNSVYHPVMTYPLPYKYRVVSSEIISK